jgi:fibronectin type 3 domain-containing protein
MKLKFFLAAIVLCCVLPLFANTPGKVYVALSWTDATCTAPACTFNLYRSNSPNACSGTPTPLVTGITSTSYTDNAVTAGQSYYYDVTAVTGGVESLCSNEAQIAVQSTPAAPTGLQGTAQ